MTYTNKQDTLSNVTTQETGLMASCVGLTSNVLPNDNAKGVSVRYAFDANKRWYVLRITYNRLDKAQDSIDINKAEVYLPLHYVVKVINGKKKRLKEPLLPNILFVYTTKDYIESVVKDPANDYITYYYNHFAKDNYGNNPPLTVRYSEMMNFIRLTSIDNEHIFTVEPEHCHYKSGDIVRVTQGQFTGVVGKVVRVAGQQRVAVNVEGVCTVVTAYIPNDFMIILSQNLKDWDELSSHIK